MTSSGGRLTLGLERARLVAEAVDIVDYQRVSGEKFFGGKLTLHYILHLSCQFLQFLGKIRHLIMSVKKTSQLIAVNDFVGEVGG